MVESFLSGRKVAQIVGTKFIAQEAGKLFMPLEEMFPKALNVTTCSIYSIPFFRSTPH